jgi:hypothetical protein
MCDYNFMSSNESNYVHIWNDPDINTWVACFSVCANFSQVVGQRSQNCIVRSQNCFVDHHKPD